MDIELKWLHFKTDRINDIYGRERSRECLPVDHPEILVDIQVKGIYRIRAEMMSFAGKDIHVLSIIPIEPEISGDPGKTAAILYNIIDEAIGKALLGANVLDFPAVLIGDFGLWKGRKAGSEQQEAAQ